MATTLIIGSSGQLGSDFVRFLGEDKQHIALTSKDIDISNPDSVANIFSKYEPDIVINCAAYTAVDNAESDELRAFQVNALGATYLVDSCIKHNAKFIHFSTDYVFEGSPSDAEKFPDGYPEDHPTKPEGVYARSKSEGEKAILESELEDYLLIRVAWLNGYNGKNFVKTMAKLIKERSSLNVVSDQIGTPSFSENVVFNTLQLIRQNKKGVYHIAASDHCSWYEISCAIRDWLGETCEIKAIPTNQYPTPAKRPHFSGLSTAKIKEIDGIKLYPWKPQLNALMQELFA